MPVKVAMISPGSASMSQAGFGWVYRLGNVRHALFPADQVRIGLGHSVVASIF